MINFNPTINNWLSPPTTNRILSFEMAAREIAANPYMDDKGICRKYGIFLDQITEDEANYLSRLVEEISERGL